MIVLKQGSSEACKLVWSFHLCPYSSTNSLLLSGGLLPRKKWKWSVVWGGFKKSCTSGKGTIHGLRLQDFQDSETLRLWDSGTLFVYLASIFVFTLLLPGHLLECNEIYPSVKHKAWGLLIGFSSLLEYEITQNASLRLIWSHTAFEQPLELWRHQYPQHFPTLAVFCQCVTSCSLRVSGVSESWESRESWKSQSLRTMNCTIATCWV